VCVCVCVCVVCMCRLAWVGLELGDGVGALPIAHSRRQEQPAAASSRRPVGKVCVVRAKSASNQ
jgi:hypothetical protein